MGLGYAMSEEILLDETGRMRNANFLDYHMPTALDMPLVFPILVELDDPNGPYGAKGMAEMATIGMPEALMGAVHQATGVWIKTLPITPEKILFTLRKRKEE